MEFNEEPNLFLSEDSDFSSERMANVYHFEENFNASFSHSSNLSFLLKTRNLIQDYNRISAQRIKEKQVLLPQGSSEEDAVDFNSEDEEEEKVFESYDDYIALLSSCKSNDKLKNPTNLHSIFKFPQNKLKFHFGKSCLMKKLGFINSHLMKLFNKLVVLNKGIHSKTITKVKVYICKCGKRFEDSRKLGGHASHCGFGKRINSTF